MIPICCIIRNCYFRNICYRPSKDILIKYLALPNLQLYRNSVISIINAKSIGRSTNTFAKYPKASVSSGTSIQLLQKDLTKSFEMENKAPKTHIKARSKPYPRSKEDRTPVKDDQVSWSVKFDQYEPHEYTSDTVSGKSGKPIPEWADTGKVSPKRFNTVDGDVNRISYHGTYDLDGSDRPKNPVGRTGISGRGCLGRWGPNHAADPIVTRWKRNEKGEKLQKDGKYILEFVAVQRTDNKEWAIPGGMVDPGENISATLRREFGEEALNSMQVSPKEKDRMLKAIDTVFNNGTLIYKGYVDDPRNTDNAWMETVAMNFHDDDGSSVGMLKLHAGSDAAGVKWMELNHELQLYASHVHFLEETAKKLNAYW
ncbi:ADP-ribose pyrophosphatase, mitochondrial-like [Physella acuta]|uniref:ADP-ribose pyrophosphatase, mitochondrial-like n=1 Tax=Physella acuta TaxID=109671 RepID=UPI0027DC9F7C|nr:ADP-ribose pyrophosphatase, mitochondrial-like [Physella acuta]XP_059176215.1 ADP-ribose pyrophosphatase, mitochondrial-like [Physella acuta]XP_059176216.1 ADP-ribose pyrophosphatase, mitochondrial-like [Physella acuta]XP_059176217.1 ADP-ribose pyrophosphatase, mitochondrial-like [Physella acuta]XP_059176218.1 ADP-ribose pyrophosphatase, mitochondrial-like [Physella acuta]